MPDIDKHIDELLKMLQSPKASKRYEACEYLRVAPTITPEAIIALQNALNDTDAEVADAAQRSLNLHTLQSKTDEAAEFEGEKMDTGYGKYIVPIIMISLISAPIFDFMPGALIAAGFGGNGGCGGMLLSPVLAIIISPLTGVAGWAILAKIEKPILVGLVCGFIAGTIAALIYAPFPC